VRPAEEPLGGRRPGGTRAGAEHQVPEAHDSRGPDARPDRRPGRGAPRPQQGVVPGRRPIGGRALQVAAARRHQPRRPALPRHLPDHRQGGRRRRPPPAGGPLRPGGGRDRAGDGGAARRAQPVPGDRRRIAGGERGQGARGPAAHRLGHRQPAAERDEAADRRHRPLRPGRAQGPRPQPGPRGRQPLQHLQGGRPAADADLGAGPGVARGHAPPRRHDVSLLRPLRQGRQARLRHHALGVRSAEGRSPPQGPPVTPAAGPALPPLSGHTRVVGVIGDPVSHSLSPALHNSAFEALRLDWVYVAFPVPRGRGADAVAAIPALGLVGFNVTMPHKEDVAAACDELTPDAAALRSVNTVVARPGGRTLGDSTDGPGFLDALADEDVAVAGQPVLVLGAGGAARAVVLALGRAGATVTVAARRPEAAESAAALAPGARATPLVAADPSGFSVVVNATPLGMAGGDALPLDPEALHPGQAVVDLVYHPADTPLLTSARRQGAVAVNGLGMLLHQAARSFTLWTGRPAPVDAMRAAVTTALAGR